MVAGAPESAPDLEGAVARVEEMVAGGASVSAACRVGGRGRGIRRRALYEAVTARRRAEAG